MQYFKIQRFKAKHNKSMILNTEIKCKMISILGSSIFSVHESSFFFHNRAPTSIVFLFYVGLHPMLLEFIHPCHFQSFSMNELSSAGACTLYYGPLMVRVFVQHFFPTWYFSLAWSAFAFFCSQLLRSLFSLSCQ